MDSEHEPETVESIIVKSMDLARKGKNVEAIARLVGALVLAGENRLQRAAVYRAMADHAFDMSYKYGLHRTGRASQYLGYSLEELAAAEGSVDEAERLAQLEQTEASLDRVRAVEQPNQGNSDSKEG